MIGLIIMGVATVGIIASVVLELKFKEPKYLVAMKVLPLLFAIGCAMHFQII